MAQNTVANDTLADELRTLRRSGRLAQARRLVVDRLRERPDAALASLAWQHDDIWWQPIHGPRVTLRRRGPDDLALVRQCWQDDAFMERFNRMAPPLPTDDDALRQLLAREQATIVGEARSLHWTIETHGRKVGFISIADILLGHRRAEYLIGVREHCSPWVGPEASHLALGFLGRAGIERLTAHFYPENVAAIEAAQKLGFVVEGTLRSYLRLADGRRTDLVVAGLVLDAAYFQRTARIRRRLLGEAAAAVPAPIADAVST